MSIEESLQFVVERDGLVQACASFSAIVEKSIVVNFSTQNGTGTEFSINNIANYNIYLQLKLSLTMLQYPQTRPLSQDLQIVVLTYL